MKRVLSVVMILFVLFAVTAFVACDSKSEREYSEEECKAMAEKEFESYWGAKGRSGKTNPNNYYLARIDSVKLTKETDEKYTFTVTGELHNARKNYRQKIKSVLVYNKKGGSLSQDTHNEVY